MEPRICINSIEHGIKLVGLQNPANADPRRPHDNATSVFLEQIYGLRGYVWATECLPFTFGGIYIIIIIWYFAKRLIETRIEFCLWTFRRLLDSLEQHDVVQLCGPIPRIALDRVDKECMGDDNIVHFIAGFDMGEYPRLYVYDFGQVNKNLVSAKKMLVFCD